MKDYLHVLYQFNETYVPYAGTSMASLLINNKDVQHMHLYVLGEKLSEQSIDTIKKMVHSFGREIEFLDTDHVVREMKSMGIPDYRGSYATNFKMFLPRFTDEKVERVLYIDADTIVNGSIKPLIDFDMQGRPLAMAYDSLGEKHALLIGHSKSDPYFNAGVILFDLPRWRELHCTERIVEHVQTVRAHYMAPDQDLLNVVLKGQIAVLDSRYDFQPIHSTCAVKNYDLLFRPETYYTDEEMEQAAEKPVIYHFFRFLGEFPWHAGTVHPFKQQFDNYLAQSPWADYVRQSPEQNGAVFRIERWMYKHIPRTLFWVVFKVSYDAFIRKCWRDSDRGRNNEKM